LRERCAFEDFTVNNKICIIGTLNDSVYETVKEYCDKLGIEFMLTPHTASVLNWVKKLKCKILK
jgi:sialic acid synthase SpsE